MNKTFHFLLSNDSQTQFLETQLCKGQGIASNDLQRLLSIAPRQDEGLHVELRRRLCGPSCDRGEARRKGLEACQEAKVILDANRLIRCVSAGARQLLNLGPEASNQIFNYFFQPGRSVLINIERPDRTVGVGRLLAVRTRWEGKAAYLVTVRDVTHRERNRVAVQSLSDDPV